MAAKKASAERGGDKCTVHVMLRTTKEATSLQDKTAGLSRDVVLKTFEEKLWELCNAPPEIKPH
jgi:hypothetical protein